MLKVQLDICQTPREAAIVAMIARNLAHEFAQMNRNFLFGTFYQACGLDQSGHVKVEVTK